MFWTNFEKLCTENGKSPNAIAAELGIPSGSITAWSKGTKPRNQTIKKIADYFDVSVQSLLLDANSNGGIRYDRIWELCKVTGKKRSYLSKAMGHSERYLLDARKQNTNIKADELAILAAELNTTPEYLTGETDCPEIKKQPTETDGLTDEQCALIDLAKTASPEQAALAFRVLKSILGNDQ